MTVRAWTVAIRGAGLALVLLFLWRSFLLPGPSALSTTAILGLLLLAWTSPASALLAFAGLAPLSTALGQVLNWSATASGLLEQMALAVSAGVSAKLLKREDQSVLAAPLFLVAAIASASAIALLPAQMAVVAVWPERLWVVFDAWVHGHSIVTPRFFVPLHYALVTTECAFLAWSAERVVRENRPLAGRLMLLGLLGGAAAGVLNMQRIAGAALRTGDFSVAFPELLMNARVSMQADVNAAASLLALAAVAGVGAWQRSTGTLVGIVLLELCVAAGLWVTGSRAGMFSALGGCVIGAAWIAIRLAGWPRRIVAIGAASLVVAVTLGAIYYPAGRNDTAAGSVQSRLTLVRAGWSMFEGAPAFGVGVTRFYDRSADFVGPDIERLAGQKYENAHNNFVQILAEQGLVGVLAIASTLLVLLVGASRAERRSPSPPRLWLVAAMVATMGTWLTGHPLLVPEFALVFWCYAGILAGTLPAPRTGWIRWPAVAGVFIVAATIPTRAATERDAAYLEHLAINLSQWQHDDEQRYRNGGRKFVLFLPGRNHAVNVPMRRAPGSPDPLYATLEVRGRDVTRLTVGGDAWHDFRMTLPDRGRQFEEVTVHIDVPGEVGLLPDVLVRVGKAGQP